MNFGHIDFSLRSRDCHLDEVKVSEPKEITFFKDPFLLATLKILFFWGGGDGFLFLGFVAFAT